MIEYSKIKLEWWKLIVGSIIAVSVVVIPLIWKAVTSEKGTPQFSFSSPVFSKNSEVTVYARNDFAKVIENLHIEWDGFLFHKGGKASGSKKVKYSWSFIPSNMINDKSLIKEGMHKVRFSFDNGKFSDYLQARISEEISVSSTKISRSLSRDLTPVARLPKKKALVIGNDNYQNIRPLEAPTKDARYIANTLESMGFTVTTGYNLKKDELKNKIYTYIKQLNNSDISIIYFSGHSIQLEGVSYLLPVDVKLSDARDIAKEGVSIKAISKKTSAFKNQVALYAASPSSMAMDTIGKEKRSPFSMALAKYLIEPNKDISSTFQNVVGEVRKVTNDKQIPWYHSTLSDDIFLTVEPTITGKKSVNILLFDIDISSVSSPYITR